MEERPSGWRAFIELDLFESVSIPSYFFAYPFFLANRLRRIRQPTQADPSRSLLSLFPSARFLAAFSPSDSLPVRDVHRTRRDVRSYPLHSSVQYRLTTKFRTRYPLFLHSSMNHRLSSAGLAPVHPTRRDFCDRGKHDLDLGRSTIELIAIAHGLCRSSFARFAILPLSTSQPCRQLQMRH